MAKEIIKVKTTYPTIKIGDIVQFNDLNPVKAVKFKDCALCCMRDACFEGENYCNYIVDDRENNIMFKEIKTKEK